MTNEWDFYFCNVDGKLASIFVDLGAAAELPFGSYPLCAYLRLTMRSPRADGMSSTEEYDRLIAVENALEAACVGDSVIYVGRCTSEGFRDFYFYTVDGFPWQDVSDACMRTFPEYLFEIGIHKDQSCSTYQNYLYPNDGERQRMKNRRVCEALERNGDSLLVAREIEHGAEFAKSSQRDEFVAQAVNLGFSMRGTPIQEDNGKHYIQLFRRDVPGLNGIDDVTRLLYELALQLGGRYDGWESEVVTNRGNE